MEDYFAMRIDIESKKITSEVLIEAIENGFKNSTKDKLEFFRDRIDFNDCPLLVPSCF